MTWPFERLESQFQSLETNPHCTNTYWAITLQGLRDWGLKSTLSVGFHCEECWDGSVGKGTYCQPRDPSSSPWSHTAEGENQVLTSTQVSVYTQTNIISERLEGFMKLKNCIIFVCFETGLPVSEVGLKFTIQLRMTLNFRPSCVYLPSAGIEAWATTLSLCSVHDQTPAPPPPSCQHS